MSFPPAVWVALGFFLGMFVGNKKFRDEVDRVIARIMGRKPGPTTPKEDAAHKLDQTEVRRGKGRVHIRDTYIDDD